MNILEEFRPLTDQINQKLLEVVSPHLPRTLKAPILYFLKTPGKKIRPLLTLLTTRLVGGEISEAMAGAVAIELFHDFTLIHDDIMDRDELRRGRPTIHIKWDDSTAILVGDLLVGLSYKELLKSPSAKRAAVMEIFSNTLIKVCEGQALDKEFESRPQVSLKEYLNMIGKKTAWLLKASCEIGAILGSADAQRIAALGNFGYQIGLGFQIQDDLLDMIAEESKLGKRVGSDFRMSKKTYVTIKYQEQWFQHPHWQQQWPGRPAEFPDFADFQRAIVQSGLAHQIEKDIEKHLDNALQFIAPFFPLNDSNPLYRLTLFLRKRQF